MQKDTTRAKYQSSTTSKNEIAYVVYFITRTWLRYVRVFAVAIPSVCLSVCRLSVCL